MYCDEHGTQDTCYECMTFNYVFIERKEFEEIHEKIRWLECLESAGIDNWSGFEIAQELFSGGK